jgi:hypothetical protein
LFRACIRSRAQCRDNKGRAGMLHSVAKNSKEFKAQEWYEGTHALLPHHITMARRISRTQRPKTRSLRYTSDMA